MTDKPAYPIRLFVAGMLTFALTGVIPAIYGLAVPIYSRAFGMSEAEAGVLLSAHGAGAFLLVVAGIFGLPGLTARLSLGLFGAGLIGLWLAPDWWGKVAATFLVGMGHGLAAVVFNRRFLTEFGTRGPGMVGLINAAYAVGAIVGPFVVVALAGNISLVFGLSGGLALMLIAVVQPSGQRPIATPLTGLITPRWSILGFAILSATVEVGTTGFGPAALIADGWSDAGAAGLVSGFFASFLLGRIALYWLTQVLSSPVLYLIGMTGAAACLAVSAMALPATGFVIAGGFIGISFPAYFVWVSDLLGRDGRIASAVIAASLGGSALCPFLLRPVLLGYGIGSVFWLIAGTAALAAVLVSVVLVVTRSRHH